MMRQSIDKAMQMAMRHHQVGHLAEAEKIYREVLAEKPDHADALHLLGVVGAQRGQTAAALELMRQAIEMKPSDPSYHNDLGNCLRDGKQLDEAIGAYERAVALKPDYVMALSNLGNALCDAGRLDEGIEAYRRAAKLKPDFAGVHNNLGKAYRESGRLEESIAALNEAIRLKPDYAEAHHNLSLALLAKGEYARGWAEHEWRLRLRHAVLGAQNLAEPRWDGSALNGRTILVHAEQGLGDTIQFARYVPTVAARGGKVILRCQPALVRLLGHVTGVERVIGDGEGHPKCDVQCPLMSLPFVMGMGGEFGPYVRADDRDVERWAGRLSGFGGKKVGIVWAGSAGHTNDHNRSISPGLLEPLAKARAISFVSLQKDAASQPAGLKLIDFTAELRDFADTAALVANLDLVISVDTAVAHLAGAMGKAVWVLLPLVADWRWGMAGEESGWYPSARFFRQRSAGDWAEAIDRVGAALQVAAGFRG